jgi:integrase
MPTSKRKTWEGRISLGRDEHGKQQFHWVGRFATKRERDEAVAEARATKPWLAAPSQQMTCDEWAQRYLARYERVNKLTSHQTATQALKPFRREFGDRAIGDVGFVEAEDWAKSVPAANVSQVVALFNYVKGKRAIEHNPFDGLGSGSRGRGRADENPPTVKELERLCDACDALGEYAPQMRDLIDFAALTLMRPGELYELRHTDVDVAANRINVARRVYRGNVDVPKNGQPKLIALVPPARDILLRQPTRSREDGLVFVSKRGQRLSAPALSLYWAQVKARAGLDFDFYLATKHYGVHRLYKLGLSRRAIAAQAGWSEHAVDKMLRVYGHTDLVALAEVDALYGTLGDAGTATDVDLRDANVTHDPAKPAQP